MEIDRDAISRYLFKFMGKSEKRRILRIFYKISLFLFLFERIERIVFDKMDKTLFFGSLVLLFRQIGWVKLGGADKTPLGRE